MKDTLLSSYDYFLPKELIAKNPANPRDSSKLLIYNRKRDKVEIATFKDLINFIPKDTNFVFNNTKVLKARLFGKKESGGRVEVFFNYPKANAFVVQIRGRVKEGIKIFFDNNFYFLVEKLNEDGSREGKFFYKEREVDFNKLTLLLEKYGLIPLPPYIKREVKREDELNYQSVFAKEAGAVAAPTASLHFTKELFEKIKKSFEVYFVTLHISSGTFKPVEVENILEHKMHKEFYSIPKETINLINSDKKILAVGTTVVRTIEYFIRTKKESGSNDLFLHPLNKPKRVDYLLTNFHLPKSTLIMLVASFIGREKTLELYEFAIKNRFRFYSYGDAMLIC